MVLHTVLHAFLCKTSREFVSCAGEHLLTPLEETKRGVFKDLPAKEKEVKVENMFLVQDGFWRGFECFMIFMDALLNMA